MNDFKRVIAINTGWSEDYRGGQVVGNFGYLSSGVGHERFNFLPDRKGRYYGYSPPLGESFSPPKPKKTDDWLVFFVSKRPGKPGLYLVGWYEGANFEGQYTPRPDAGKLGVDSDGQPFSYTVSANKVFPIPLSARNMKVSGSHLKRSFAYLRGNGDTEAWREKLAVELLAFRNQFLEQANEAESDAEEPELAFVRNAKRRKEIETAAVDAVIAHFSDWDCESKEAEKCGYDLLFTRKKSGEILHVEVKGTSLDSPAFFITENERAYGEYLSQNDSRARKSGQGNWRPLWKLAVVHDALGTPKPNIYNYAEMTRAFGLSPYAWRGTLKGNN